MIIKIFELCGSFAENKDIAREIREKKIKSNLKDEGNLFVLDFDGVDASTQSFIHALISGFFQKYGEKALKWFEFQNCNPTIKTLIATVINYSLE